MRDIAVGEMLIIVGKEGGGGASLLSGVVPLTPMECQV